MVPLFAAGGDDSWFDPSLQAIAIATRALAARYNLEAESSSDDGYHHTFSKRNFPDNINVTQCDEQTEQDETNPSSLCTYVSAWCCTNEDMQDERSSYVDSNGLHCREQGICHSKLPCVDNYVPGEKEDGTAATTSRVNCSMV
jgi:hypothetical protein